MPGERLDPGQRYCAASGDSGDEPGLHRAVALPQQSGGGVASAAWFGARSDRCSYQGIIEAPAGGRRNDLRGRLPRCLPRRVRSIRSIRVRPPSTHPREERPEDCPGAVRTGDVPRVSLTEGTSLPSVLFRVGRSTILRQVRSGRLTRLPYFSSPSTAFLALLCILLCLAHGYTGHHRSSASQAHLAAQVAVHQHSKQHHHLSIQCGRVAPTKRRNTSGSHVKLADTQAAPLSSDQAILTRVPEYRAPHRAEAGRQRLLLKCVARN